MTGYLNYTEIIIASIISYIWGSIWYSPIGMGDAWLESKGITKAKMEDIIKNGEFNFARTCIIEFITRVIRSYVYALILYQFGPAVFWDYLYVSLLICFGFSVTENLSSWLWDQQTFTYFLINAGEVIISSTITSPALIKKNVNVC